MLLKNYEFSNKSGHKGVVKRGIGSQTAPGVVYNPFSLNTTSPSIHSWLYVLNIGVALFPTPTHLVCIVVALGVHVDLDVWSSSGVVPE